MKHEIKRLHFISFLLTLSQLISWTQSSQESSNIKFLTDIVSKVENPAELMDNVQKAFSNPDYLDKIFNIFEASDFPDRPWNPEVEKKRFQSVMLDTTGNGRDQYKYLEIILNKVNTRSFAELEKIYTMSESLDFVIDFYENALKAEEDSSKHLASLEKAVEDMKVAIKYVEKSIKFLTPLNEESQKVIEGFKDRVTPIKTFLQWHVSRFESREYKEHRANLDVEDGIYTSQLDLMSILGEQGSTEIHEYGNLAEMAKLLSRHAFNVNFQIGLSGFKINTDKEPKIKFNLDVVKKLKDAYERVEGLRNVVLVEKDSIKKAKGEQELKEAENFLQTFVKTEETMDQVRYISDASNLVVSSYARNTKAVAENKIALLELVNQWTLIRTSRDKLLKQDSEYWKMANKVMDKAEALMDSGKLEGGMKIEL